MNEKNSLKSILEEFKVEIPRLIRYTGSRRVMKIWSLPHYPTHIKSISNINVLSLKKGKNYHSFKMEYELFYKLTKKKGK